MLPLQQVGVEAHGLNREESSHCRRPMEDSDWDGIITALRAELSIMDLGKVQPLIQRIAKGIHWLDGPLTRYCGLTCPSCEDPCCQGLEVFYNWTDLIFLAARGGATPSGQTRTHPAAPCRYLGRNGCRLPRLSRPYVCVWFICDAQMEYFQEEPAAFQRQFIGMLQHIRTSRLALEAFFEHHLKGE